MKMGPGWEPWSSLRSKSNQLLVKLFVSALLIGISTRLFFSHYNAFIPISEPSTAALKAHIPAAAGDVNYEKPQRGPPSMGRSGNQDTVVPETALDIDYEYSQKGKCHLFSGEWIQDPLGPAYTNTSCPYIEPPQNCMKNGRPDTGYLYWRWKPQDCELASFDEERFLGVMRNKSWALIGDSIFRNHAQSLLCFLSKAEEPVEVYHDATYKSRRWHFPSHNFTLSLIWTPFLVKADIFEDDDGRSTSEIQLHLDTLDSKWTSQYHTFDYILISGGQWFLKPAIYVENSAVVGCFSCIRKNTTKLRSDYSYRKVLRQVFDFFTNSDHKPLVIYRTWTPDHFENGEWSSGGTCNRTMPFREGEFEERDIDRSMRRIELDEFRRAAAGGLENGVRLKLLDTYHLSLMRPDGHSGPYRKFHPFDGVKDGAVQNDCLHWCLPGPIDTWNDLLMEMVLGE